MPLHRTESFVSAYLDKKYADRLDRDPYTKAKVAINNTTPAGKSPEPRETRSWSKSLRKPSGDKKSELYSKYVTRDGFIEKTPLPEGAEYDHGDSATRAKYGNYTFGRNVGDGRDLQVPALGRHPLGRGELQQ